MKTLVEFQEQYLVAVGDLFPLTSYEEMEEWINEGRTRIGVYDKKWTTVDWDAGDTEIPLPADFVSFSRLRSTGGSCMDGFTEWGNSLVFDSDTGATNSGQGRLFYSAYFPRITSTEPSTLPEEADRGLLSYALYRFFQKLSSNRTNYKRYSTLAGANAVDITDVQSEASRHYDDFIESGASLPPAAPIFPYARES